MKNTSDKNFDEELKSENDAESENIEFSEDDFEDDDFLTDLEEDLPPVERKNLYDKLNIPVKWLDVIIVGIIVAMLVIILIGALKGNGII